MTNSNPYDFAPLQPTGRNETDTANTYAPEDMIKIYEQQFLIPVPEEKLTEFLPALKDFMTSIIIRWMSVLLFSTQSQTPLSFTIIKLK